MIGDDDRYDGVTDDDIGELIVGHHLASLSVASRCVRSGLGNKEARKQGSKGKVAKHPIFISGSCIATCAHLPAANSANAAPPFVCHNLSPAWQLLEHVLSSSAFLSGRNQSAIRFFY